MPYRSCTLSLLVVVFLTVAEANFKVIGPSADTTALLGHNLLSAPDPAQIKKCSCDTAPQDILVCASNALTYTSTCAFQCAKKRVPRLKIRKQGTCDGMTRKDFFQREQRDFGKILY